MNELFVSLQETLDELKNAKPEERSELARRVQICITEYEKLIAYFVYYVLNYKEK